MEEFGNFLLKENVGNVSSAGKPGPGVVNPRFLTALNFLGICEKA
jgi:hypothetical protein